MSKGGSLCLLDAKPAEPADRDVLLHPGARLGDEVADAHGRVADVLLVEQAVVLEERLDLAGHDPVDDLGGLALLLGLVPVDLPLLLEKVGRNLVPADPAGPGGRDMEREVPSQDPEVVAL